MSRDQFHEDQNIEEKMMSKEELLNNKKINNNNEIITEMIVCKIRKIDEEFVVSGISSVWRRYEKIM